MRRCYGRGVDCASGWTPAGKGFACSDVDGCLRTPCFAGVTCTDVRAPGVGSTCGSCPSGYTGDGAKTTVDEGTGKDLTLEDCLDEMAKGSSTAPIDPECKDKIDEYGRVVVVVPDVLVDLFPTEPVTKGGKTGDDVTVSVELPQGGGSSGGGVGSGGGGGGGGVSGASSRATFTGRTTASIARCAVPVMTA